ncbi:hypothetical protein ACNFBT_25115 [Pseudomonas sp. NY15181]|uniref:hypothetical protein n=1 Tax=Pseudomonas sp. NY15181 TaxID=3400349 RepID=UPI003A87D3F2
MLGRIARTVATCSSWAAGVCAALALLPLAVAQDFPSNGALRVADDDSRQASNTPALPYFGDSLQRTTRHVLVIMTAGIGHPQKNHKAAPVLYGQRATSAGSATQPSTGNIAVSNATIKTGLASAGMTFATDGCNSGISEHNGDTYPNTWSAPLCPGSNKTGDAESQALYAQGHLNGSAIHSASVYMAASGGPPHTHLQPIDAGCPACVCAGNYFFS